MPNLIPATLVPSELFDGSTPHNGFAIGLLGEDPSAIVGPSLADLVEPDFPGYHRAGPLLFEADVENTLEQKVYYFDPAAFKLDVDTEEFDVFGWFLICRFDNGDVLLSATVWDEEETWGYAGDNTVINPSMQLEIATSGSL